MEIYNKLEMLKNFIKEKNRLAIAFSGGTDSTLLLKVAYDVLKENVIAITARSSTFPEREFREAEQFAVNLGVKYVTFESNELKMQNFYKNPVDRCYHCKKHIFEKICEIAYKNDIEYIADGSNIDDLGDYRPGMLALNELAVISPLKEANMSKEDIRILSKEMNLPTWDKPAYACLASRFPYGQRITKRKLDMVGKAEQYMHDLGFRQVRVRHHGDIARIEVTSNEFGRVLKKELMDEIYDKFTQIGFKYTALDLKGYRMGSMNEGIVRKPD